MDILFVCKHNRFRSKVAEAIFKKLNKKHEIRSRGIFHDIDVANFVIKVMKERGFLIKDKKSRGVSRQDILWADLIVIVANDIPRKLFSVKGKKVLVWKVADVNQADFPGIERTIDVIEEKVRKLIVNLKYKKV